jgi:hypothetical protein
MILFNSITAMLDVLQTLDEEHLWSLWRKNGVRKKRKKLLKNLERQKTTCLEGKKINKEVGFK